MSGERVVVGVNICLCDVELYRLVANWSSVDFCFLEGVTCTAVSGSVDHAEKKVSSKENRRHCRE